MSLRAIMSGAAAVAKGVSTWVQSDQGKTTAKAAQVVSAYRNKQNNPHDSRADATLKKSVSELGAQVVKPAAKGITAAVAAELKRNRGRGL